MLPLTHVHNIARCSVVWNAETPVTQKSFPRCTIKTPVTQKRFPRCTIKFRGERRFSKKFSALLRGERRFSGTFNFFFQYCRETFYPGSTIKLTGRIGVPPIPDKWNLVCLSRYSTMNEPFLLSAYLRHHTTPRFNSTTSRAFCTANLKRCKVI